MSLLGLSLDKVHSKINKNGMKRDPSPNGVEYFYAFCSSLFEILLLFRLYQVPFSSSPSPDSNPTFSVRYFKTNKQQNSTHFFFFLSTDPVYGDRVLSVLRLQINNMDSRKVDRSPDRRIPLRNKTSQLIIVLKSRTKLSGGHDRLRRPPDSWDCGSPYGDPPGRVVCRKRHEVGFRIPQTPNMTSTTSVNSERQEPWLSLSLDVNIHKTFVPTL